MDYKEITSKNLWFNVGDLVTAYRSGYYRVTKITPRFITESDLRDGMERDGYKLGEEYSPIVEYVQVARSDGTPVKGKTSFTCDASYIQLAPQQLSASLQELVQTEVRLKKLLLEEMEKE